MAKAAEVILTVLDRHLRQPVHLRLMGGAALTLAYGLDRATEDADFLMDDGEAQFLAEHRDFGRALEEANAELEPLGLYVTNLWGPEQQILTPRWRESCRPVSRPELRWITLEALAPLDIIVSKMARADDEDLEDMRYLIRHEQLDAGQIAGAIDSAMVPEILREAFERSRSKIAALANQ